MCEQSVWNGCDFHMQCVDSVVSACADVKLGYQHGGTVLSGGLHWAMFNRLSEDCCLAKLDIDVLKSACFKVCCMFVF